jgi:hypothetical protein
VGLLDVTYPGEFTARLVAFYLQGAPINICLQTDENQTAGQIVTVHETKRFGGVGLSYSVANDVLSVTRESSHSNVHVRNTGNAYAGDGSIANTGVMFGPMPEQLSFRPVLPQAQWIQYLRGAKDTLIVVFGAAAMEYGYALV